MSKSTRALLGFTLSLGLLAPELDGAPKPPPAPAQCPTCPIVYTQTASGGRADLMLMQADGTQKTLLLAGARNVGHNNPLWAPDGQWIAFKSNMDGQIGTWLIKRDGTGRQKVISPCDGSTWWLYAAWRPGAGTAHWYAYQDRCNGNINPDIWTIRIDFANGALDVSEPVCLTCPGNEANEDAWSQPAWTHDGLHLSARKLPGSTDEFDAEYVVFDFADDEHPVLTNPRSLDLTGLGLVDPRSIRDGAWAKTSNALLARDVASSDLWLFGIDHDIGVGTIVVLTGVNLTESYTNWSYFDPRWSPDDSKIVFCARSSAAGGPWGIFVAPPVIGLGNLVTPIAPSNIKAQAIYPDWNPAQ